MTPSHQIIEIAYESQRMGRDRKGVENKIKFYVSSRDVRIVCARLNSLSDLNAGHHSSPVRGLL